MRAVCSLVSFINNALLCFKNFVQIYGLAALTAEWAIGAGGSFAKKILVAMMDKSAFFILIEMQMGVVVAPSLHVLFKGEDVMLLVFQPEKEADSFRCLWQAQQF